MTEGSIVAKFQSQVLKANGIKFLTGDEACDGFLKSSLNEDKLFVICCYFSVFAIFIFLQGSAQVPDQLRGTPSWLL